MIPIMFPSVRLCDFMNNISPLLVFPFYEPPTRFLFFVQGMDVSLFKDAYEGPKYDFLLSHAAYCRDVLKLKKGQKAVISNGRVSHSLVSRR